MALVRYGSRCPLLAYESHPISLEHRGEIGSECSMESRTQKGVKKTEVRYEETYMALSKKKIIPPMRKKPPVTRIQVVR